MKKLETSIDIDGAPAEVWSVLADVARYPEWNPFLRELSGALAVGARLRVRIEPPGGRAMTFRPTVRKAEPGRALVWLGHLIVPGLFDGEHSFEIEPVGIGAARFRQGETFRGLLTLVLPESVYESTRQGFEAMNRALKARVEGARRRA